MTFHRLYTDILPPDTFTDPFCYEPHPLCLMAVNDLIGRIEKPENTSNMAFLNEARQGKMFGVLVAQKPRLSASGAMPIGYIAAYSGQICGRSDWQEFVPAVFDYLQTGGYFKLHEQEISDINKKVETLEADSHYLQQQQELHLLHREAERTIEEYKNTIRKAKEKRDRLRLQTPTNATDETNMIRESQFMKAELKRMKQRFRAAIAEKETLLNEKETEIELLKKARKQKSDALQRWLFEHFTMLNAEGERRNLIDIFAEEAGKIPPAGSGECCEPKLLQYAYRHRLHPLCMAMFWYGASPKDEIRHHLHYYPACNGKCKPILSWMLRGLPVAPSATHFATTPNRPTTCAPYTIAPSPTNATSMPDIPIVYEDEAIVVINKPAGMLSVPGKACALSVYDLMRMRYPDSNSPFIVHRLDMATSGLLVIAKTKNAHRILQRQFAEHTIRKQYIAVLDGVPDSCRWPSAGIISLPLRPDLADRPRQLVDFEHGKEAVTEYKILRTAPEETRIALFPHTGRTHQLRIHCAHPYGLNCPIKGDNLYGTRSQRLYLHAESMEFIHPVSGRCIKLSAEAEF